MMGAVVKRIGSGISPLWGRLRKYGILKEKEAEEMFSWVPRAVKDQEEGCIAVFKNLTATFVTVEYET